MRGIPNGNGQRAHESNSIEYSPRSVTRLTEVHKLRHSTPVLSHHITLQSNSIVSKPVHDHRSASIRRGGTVIISIHADKTSLESESSDTMADEVPPIDEEMAEAPPPPQEPNEEPPLEEQDNLPAQGDGNQPRGDAEDDSSSQGGESRSESSSSDSTDSNPPDALYKVAGPHTLEKRRAPYSGSKTGLGIQLMTDKEMKEVLMTHNGHRVTMNEMRNKYGVKLLALTIQEMLRNVGESDPTGGKVGEKTPFIAVVKQQMKVLTSYNGTYEEHATIHQRLENYMWSVMCGFNKGERNAMLDDILIFYCKIRLGMEPTEGDELYAAFSACQETHVGWMKDQQSHSPSYQYVVLVHLLNGHMKHHNMTGITFHHDAEVDEKKPAARRAANSKLCHYMLDESVLPYHIETRDTVIRELTDFLTSKRIVITPAPPSVPAPAEEPQAAAAQDRGDETVDNPVPRARRSLDVAMPHSKKKKHKRGYRRGG